MLKRSEILSQWKKDGNIKETELYLDENNIERNGYIDAAHAIPKLHSKYLGLYGDVSEEINRLEKELGQTSHERMRYYMGYMTPQEEEAKGLPHDPYAGAKLTKVEKTAYLTNDNVIATLKQQLDDVKVAKETLKDILEQIRWRGQLLRTIHDFKKFARGDD